MNAHKLRPMSSGVRADDAKRDLAQGPYWTFGEDTKARDLNEK
jgi:hypothetical protein